VNQYDAVRYIRLKQNGMLDIVGHWRTDTAQVSCTAKIRAALCRNIAPKVLRNVSIFRASFNMLSANEMRGMVFKPFPQSKFHADHS
jgi:hypothetical protein